MQADCIYHLQAKCDKSWADGCRLVVRRLQCPMLLHSVVLTSLTLFSLPGPQQVQRDAADPSKVVSFRWLSQTYWRDETTVLLV